MNLPSKELLSEVLCVEVIRIGDCKYPYPNNDRSKVYYVVEGTYGVYSLINIYELAYRCKEWAIEQGFSITSTNSYMGDLQPVAQPVSSNGCEYPWINGVTEPEAIFKACQWVLDNKETR